ncbi:hypothetical protein KSP40_PGU013665 [Platanthera guangdongensis]|uniref:Uncharacterized protein n=1 Tax=Platanthera guangdongensis TaxID=2320717 RepID=A0ABR2N4E4_9ASPA
MGPASFPSLTFAWATIRSVCSRQMFQTLMNEVFHSHLSMSVVHGHTHEGVHKTLQRVHANNFNPHFLLSLVQQCGALDIQKKCHLIYEHLNKISVLSLDASIHSLFKEVDEGLGADQNADILRMYPECSAQQEIERISHSRMLNTIHSVNEAVISIGAMQRANSTMEDFCRSYFMFHGLDASKAQSIFSFLPVLYFTESYIYQLDTLNESKLLQSTDGSEKGFRRCSASDPFDPLIDLLQQQGLMTERIRTELHLGVEYWKLERLLCDELTKKDMVLSFIYGPFILYSLLSLVFPLILIEDVMRAIQLKSFDYRVLNLLLYQLRGQPVNELHMEFLSASEFLVEEDVIDNTFNILRMFVGIYGVSKAPAMLAKCINKAEEKYDRLAKELDPELSFDCWRRYEEATREGTKLGQELMSTSICLVCTLKGQHLVEGQCNTFAGIRQAYQVTVQPLVQENTEGFPDL